LEPAQAKEIFSVSETDEESAVSKPVIESAGYRELLLKVTPAVVSVFPRRLVSSDESNPLSRYFGKGEKEEGSDSDDDGNETMGVGSGVILSQDGWIVTNSHVVHMVTGNLADSVLVELSDRRRFPATIVGADPKTDIALLKIEANDLETVPIGDSDEVTTGDLVFAVGNPFKLGITATMGMVSATRRTSLNMMGNGGYESFIQTDAAINPGNSGGALVDASGRLVGINTAIYSRGGGNLGIGFAIPTRLMSRVLEGLARDGEMKRGFFGMAIEEVDEEKAKAAGAEKIAGAYVEDIMPEGPSDVGGLQKGDIVQKANNRLLDTRGDLRVELSCVAPGETIELEVIREGKSLTVKVKAAEGPSRVESRNVLFSIAAFPGIKFSLSEEGLQVREVNGETPASGDHLEVGMILASINGKEISSVEEASAAVKKGINKVVTKQGGAIRTLAIRLE